MMKSKTINTTTTTPCALTHDGVSEAACELPFHCALNTMFVQPVYMVAYNELDVLPPHLSLELNPSPLKAEGISLQLVCLVHQQLDFLPTIQHLLNVLYHHLLHLRNFPAHSGDGVRLWVVAEVIHLLAQHPPKLVVVRESQCGLCCLPVCTREPGLRLFQEGERDASPQLLRGHTDVCEAIHDQQVKDVAVMRIADFVVLLRQAL
mmetsp:Transcript_9047/g.33268  ORF Transcript_9047/g.33268 Transcript_9047/m.33268 type:complete len:206 (+) Transcript_9047:568-1185(+)